MLTYEDWTSALSDRFFRPDFAGEPVMFFVDDDCLAEICGCDSATAAAQIAGVVRARLALSTRRRLFTRIERVTSDWRRAGGEGAPPCLPLLAIAVLAASRMRRTRRFAANNYYDRFLEVLDAPVRREDVVASYAESVPRCWQALEWWLDEHNAGALGYSTIADDLHFTNIGYADSQTLFSSSDHDKLGQFLSWIEYVPGETPDEGELLASFKLWAARRDDLSVGADLMASSEAHAPQLGQILTAAARRWTGSVRTSDGRQQGQLRLMLDPFPTVTLTLAAERPEGFPSAAEFRASTGTAVELKSSQPGWYDQVPVELSASILRSGIRLVGSSHALALAGSDLHVLGKDTELGWASVPHVSPAASHWLLVVDERLPELEAHLRLTAREGWESIATPNLPAGWRAIRSVTIDSQPDVTVPDWLRRLAPIHRMRVALVGGLALARGRRVFLAGGEPDLELPPEEGVAVDVRVDDVPITMRTGRSSVRLADVGLPADNHRVSLGHIDLTFSTIETLGRLEASIPARIGHVLRKASSGYRPDGHGPRNLTGSPPAAKLWVVGAGVIGRPEDVPNRASKSLVLPGGATRVVLLGRRSDEIEELAPPRRPTWMSDAGLGMRVFEHVPSFPVVWVISDWRGAPKIRTRLLSDMPPSEDDDVDEELSSRWSEEIRRALPPVDPMANGLWTSYVTAASSAERSRMVSPSSDAGSTIVPGRARNQRTDAGEPENAAVREASASRWDLLLEWLSEVGEGSFAQLREAVAWVFEEGDGSSRAPSPSHVARSLATIGHIEISWTDRHWSIAPTTVARLPLAGAHALVTGSRTRVLEKRLSNAVLDEKSDLFPIFHAPTEGPTAIFIACDEDADLEWLASTLGIRYEHSASERIGELLPELDACLEGARSAPGPSRFGVTKFDLETLRWGTTGSDESPGLYQYEAWAGSEYRLLDEGGTTYSLDRANAIYVALSRWGQNVLRFMPDSINGTLVVPSAAPLPDLQARAAALCSGLVPPRVGQTFWYQNVPRWLGERLAWSLDQTLLDLA